MYLIPRIPPLYFILAALTCAASSAFAEEKWITLFDGKTLKGWHQLDGTAKYEFHDGAIVGSVTEGSKMNSFLVTDETYEDFVFECEFKPDAGINSGVQFRSVPADDKVKRVYGYQYEIDPTARGLTGGVQEEGRRAWLSPSANHGDSAVQWAKKYGQLCKIGDWNTLRIEARGTAIRTWLNGVPLADFRDTAENRVTKGFIGLQIHRTDKQELYGKGCAFRNLRIQPLEPKADAK
jgi:hypothetical protein